jgi:hypothetical protein
VLKSFHSILHSFKSVSRFIIGFILLPIRAFQDKGVNKVEVTKSPVKFGSSFYLNWDINRLGWIYVKGHGVFTRTKGLVEFNSNSTRQIHVLWISGLSLHREVYKSELNRLQPMILRLSNYRFGSLWIDQRLKVTNPKITNSIHLSSSSYLRPEKSIKHISSFRLRQFPHLF